MIRHSFEEVLLRVGDYFMKQSPIHKAAQRITETLARMQIPFAIAGALAANAHGHLRTTGDVDILISPEGLAAFKNAWLGRGWIEKFAGSRGVRDAVNGVDIDVLLAGQFPGDGLPKPVVFPQPDAVAEMSSDGVPVLRLEVLIELKLASGMTAPSRPRDLDDVIQLIRVNNLTQDYGAKLNPYVQTEFDRLWTAAQSQDEY